jgi:Cd(II)/Pb(II)-responsive transcriptional regulator
MKIGEVCGHASVPVETIRYYEKIGLLLKPDRDASGYRVYRNAHLNRLLFIKRCRNLDMTQDEIRELIRLSENPEADCREVDALLDRHLSHVRDRLNELANLETALQQLQQACSKTGTVEQCGIMGGLSSELGDLSGRDTDRRNHVPGTHKPGSH